MGLYAQYANANNFKNFLYGYIDAEEPLLYYPGCNSFINVDYNEFYDTCFNIYTANSAGLDNWGLILGITRNIYVPNFTKFFSFNNKTNPYPVVSGTGAQSFNFGGFNSGNTVFQPVDDYLFRAMLLLRYQTLTCNMSILQITNILNIFFINLAKFQNTVNTQIVSVQDNLVQMSITYTFAQTLPPQIRAIFGGYPLNINLLPKPMGVKAIIVQL